MKLMGRDRKLVRWFFGALTLVATVLIFVRAAQAFLAHEVMPGILCVVLGFALLALQILQLRNPSWPSRLW